MKHTWGFALFIGLMLSGLVGCKSSGDVFASKGSAPSDTLSTEQLRSFQYAFYNGNRAKILGHLDEAQKLFARALEINPSSAATQYEMARVLADQHRYGAATPYAEEAVTLDKNNRWYGQLLAQLYGETGRWSKAIAVMEDMIDADPDEYENYFHLGSLLTARKDYKEAMDVYDTVEERFGPSEELALQRQTIYLEQGDYDAALAEANKLIAANPGKIRYMGSKAEILEKAGKNAEAVALYNKMLETEPENGMVLLALYEDAENKGETAEAQDYLGRAFSSTDLNIDVKVNILLNMMSTPGFSSHPDTVLNLAERMQKAHPDNPKPYAVLGDIYNSLGQPQKSRDQFRKAVELDPNRPPIWQQILTLDSQLGDFDAMKAESDAAMELFPQQPVFYLFNGVALLQNKQADKAVEILNTGKNLVVDKDDLLSQFYASLGDAYHSLGRNKDSDTSYDKSLRYNPNNVVVLNNYAYYLSLRGEDLAKAEEMAKKANDLNPDMAGFQDTYAWVLFKRQNFANALFWIKEALKNGGDKDPTILEHHGDILQAMGRTADALVAWQMALDLGGDPLLLNAKITKYDGSRGE